MTAIARLIGQFHLVLSLTRPLKVHEKAIYWSENDDLDKRTLFLENNFETEKEEEYIEKKISANKLSIRSQKVNCG